MQNNLIKKWDLWIIIENNPLYVSEFGTIETEGIISPVLVERGTSKKTKNCYCNKPLTEEFVKDAISKLTGSDTLFKSHPDLDRRSWKDFTFELNAGFHKYGVNTCMQKISFLATAYAETDFRLLVEGLSQYNSSKSFYKGRGIIQLTGSAKDKNDILYSAPGAYLSYGKYIKQENKFVNTPNLISDMLHYAIDSAFWEWTIFKRVPSWGVGKDDSKALAEAKQFKREYFKDALGRNMNDLCFLIEKEEEKYFYLQQKMINGYPGKHKLNPPNGWEKRKKGLKHFKEVFEYETRCKDHEEELKFSTEGRAPWMEVAVQEIINYGGKHESTIDARVKKYHKEGAGADYGSDIAWCASFVCWCLENATPVFKSPHTAGSRFFLTDSSVELCEVFFGTMAVFSDCDSTGTKIKTSGHVTFVFGKLLDKDTYAVLGGNQGDMITLSPNYQFHGKAFPMNKKKTMYKIFRGFYKPKGYVIKETDKLTKQDEYKTLKEANDSLKQITHDTSKGESSR